MGVHTRILLGCAALSVLASHAAVTANAEFFSLPRGNYASLHAILTLHPKAVEIAAELDRQYAANQSGVGPLYCIPIILKDNYDTFDLPTTAGMRMCWRKTRPCCKCAPNSVSECWIWDRRSHASSSMWKTPRAAEQSNSRRETRQLVPEFAPNDSA